MFTRSFLGYHFDEGFISVVGEGDAKLSIVTRAGCSRFVAHVLVTATKSSLEGAQLSFESARVSPKEITAQLEKKLGKKLQIKLVDYEETKKGYDTNPVAYIQTRILIADGRGISGTEDEVKATIAKFFPDWNPSPWQEIIA
ncbi:putative NAD-P-binding protein [Phytophthora infestans]|uniref:Putative NAD-P-binding protein n=1 Tax=Phytophthora infestans TaxID=4787 RepID=A0A833SIK2_PHYIN|nr:putative NAD-P-binding protein [Phytophthora infestans]